MPRAAPAAQPDHGPRSQAGGADRPRLWAIRLKSGPAAADTYYVHFQRLVIEAGDNTFTLAFHPRLTVIAGAGRLEREGIVQELVGALGAGRDGVHLELSSDAGTRYALYRPQRGAQRVVDVDRSLDVTHQFTDRFGQINLLERAGLDHDTALRQIRLRPADLVSDSQVEDVVLSLAHVDQSRLWDVARKVQDRQDQLEEAMESAGSTAEDVEVLEEVERRHRAFEEAQAEHEQVRTAAFYLGGTAGLLLLPAAVLGGAMAMIPLALIAIAATVLSIVAWRRLETARVVEAEALREAGMTSYLAFQITRVNGLMARDHHRKRLLQATEDHDAALVEWRLLAGDVPVAWAQEHRDEIRETARQLRQTVGIRNPMALTMSPAERTASELSTAMLARIRSLQVLGQGGEGFPMVLDDPLVEVSPEAKPLLLELLNRESRNLQVVYLTDDEDVAAWARLESMTGALSLIEPSSAESTNDDNRPGSRHVSA